MGHSALSSIETLEIVSTWNSLTEPRFNCASCLKSTTKAHRDNKKFCETFSPTVIANYHDFFRYYKCPASFRTSYAIELLHLHRLFESGQLPYEGGILEQPAKFIEAMRLIDGLKLEHQKDLEAKAKRWQRTQSQSNSQSSKRKR